MSDGTQQDGGDSGDSGDIGALERDGSGARGGGLLAAIVLLTRVPLRLRARPDMAKAVPWFGIVGVMLGAAIGATFVGLAELMPPLPAAAAAVLAGILVTGAFHEDGLADVADAFAGGWTAADRLRILEDPRHGTYGVAALAGTIVVRIAALSALAPAAGIAALVAAHALARSAAIAMLATQPLARDGGLGADYASTVRRPGATAGVVCAAAFVAVATGWWIGPLAIAAVVAAVLVGWLARRKIGGITGDVLGAAEQVGECLVLLTACGLAAADPVWWSA